MIKIQDPQSQTECDTTPGKEYSTETDSGDTETIKTSAIQKFMLKILTDDEIAECLNLLSKGTQSKGRFSMWFIHKPKII